MVSNMENRARVEVLPIPLTPLAWKMVFGNTRLALGGLCRRCRTLMAWWNFSIAQGNQKTSTTGNDRPDRRSILALSYSHSSTGWYFPR